MYFMSSKSPRGHAAAKPPVQVLQHLLHSGSMAVTWWRHQLTRWGLQLTQWGPQLIQWGADLVETPVDLLEIPADPVGTPEDPVGTPVDLFNQSTGRAACSQACTQSARAICLDSSWVSYSKSSSSLYACKCNDLSPA